MEIGSFIELEFQKGMEYYSGDSYCEMSIARLNSGRAAIWHALRITGCRTIWLPYYLCQTVSNFLTRKGAIIRYYHIDNDFNPIDLTPGEEECVLIVNYFGIMSAERMIALVKNNKNIIIDNSQAFFAEPLPNALNIYSARKFIGVPDGAYVIGRDARNYMDQYPESFSSDTSLFLLQRIEYGCQGKAYEARSVNEDRINNEDIMKMSKLTNKILDSTDYRKIMKRRQDNYRTADELLKDLNQLSTNQYYASDCVPIIYPLLIENDNLLDKLLNAKHYQGHWWRSVEQNPKANEFEKWISRFMVPITIDQRYGKQDLVRLNEIIRVL